MGEESAISLSSFSPNTAAWPVVIAYCPECDEQRELEVLDPAHGYCSVCNSTVAPLQHTAGPTRPN